MGLCDVPVFSQVCTKFGGTSSDVLLGLLAALAMIITQFLSWLFTNLWKVFDTTTSVDLASPGYLKVFDLLFGIAILVMLIFFCLQLLTGLIRREPAALSRALTGLAKSVLGSFVIVGLTATLLEITDKLADGIVAATGTTVTAMGQKIDGFTETLAGFITVGAGVGPLAVAVIGVVAIAAVMVVWLSLLIRKILLLVAVVFAPVALAGFSWDATRAWFGRWASFVIAMAASKVVIVVLVLVAVNQVPTPVDLGLQSISGPLAGIALLLVAAFAPYLAYRFISFVGADIHQAVAAEQDAKIAVARPLPAVSPAALARRVQSIVAAGSLGAATGGAAAPVLAAAVTQGTGPVPDLPVADSPSGQRGDSQGGVIIEGSVVPDAAASESGKGPPQPTPPQQTQQPSGQSPSPRMRTPDGVNPWLSGNVADPGSHPNAPDMPHPTSEPLAQVQPEQKGSE